MEVVLLADREQGVEHADELGPRIRTGRRGGGLELPAPPGVDAVEVGDGEVVLARKVLVEGGLGDPGRGDDRVDPDTAHAVSVEEAEGGIENALPRLTPGSG